MIGNFDKEIFGVFWFQQPERWNSCNGCDNGEIINSGFKIKL